jgi:type I restriction enzyme S subunit
MTTLKPYSPCRNSGVDWLGDVPEHWRVKRLRSVSNLAASNVDKVSSPEELPVRLCNYTDVYYNHVITNDQKFMAGTATPEEIARFSLRGGEVLFTKDSETFDDIGIPAVADHGLENVVVGYHLMMVRPGRELYGPYLAWFFAPQVNRWQFEVSAKGVTRFGMPQSGFKDALISLPPLDEQRAIVDFLDGMDARITRFIAARRKMIALLEEDKQAVTIQAVTRGLDPDVPMKDSGVDWLGEIPAHWDVRRGANLFSERNDTGFPHLPILEVSLNTGVQIRDMGDPKRKQVMSDRSGYKRARRGDLPYNMMRMWQGAVGVSPVDGLVSPAYVVLKPGSESVSRFYAALFRTPAFKGEVSGRSRGIVSDRDRLYWDSFRQIQMPWPSPDEQQRIVERIDQESAHIDTLISRHRREIELMQEYRTRLISDVVTGKLDVRGVELPAVAEVIGEEIEAAMLAEDVEQIEEAMAQ